MLQYIREERILPEHTRLVLHYLIRLRNEALFLDQIDNIMDYFGDYFDGHLWITRQEADSIDPLSSKLKVHRYVARSSDQIGQTWEWWNSFSDHALEHCDTKEKRDQSLVYICGPQGLTDRLLDMYREHGMDIEKGHVQVEKWW
jgi:predicted ferric reductase